MKVLLLGNGGREHAIAWKIAQSSSLTRLFVAPGNAGTALLAENVDMAATDFKSIKKFVLQQEIDLVVVGPEAPLVEGIVDFFLSDVALAHIPVLGPDKASAQLEGSKDFAKQFMRRHRIPTAKYASFNAANVEEGVTFLKTMKAPYVLKADGLAAGKGVLILDSLAEAEASLREMLDGKFGAASSTVVIEEFLKGIELSVFAITDGKTYKLLPSAKDYKRIGEGDTGLNTGGMGAVSPVPFADDAFMRKVEERIVAPTIEGIRREGMNYKGFVFFGLINVNGDPYVIEYNCRMGDPETEVVIPRLKSDLLSLMESAVRGTLSESDVMADDRYAVTVMMVSGGYPGDYPMGKWMSIGAVPENVHLFHAGTKKKGERVVTNGGRVITVTGMSRTLAGARNLALEGAEAVAYDGKYFRKDIGLDVM